MNNPKISVVMPVYNSEKYLRESIESILNQTFRDFELIIIDDCSTDNSIKIVESYNDKRIKIFQNEKNIGTVKTRNIGLKKAKGKYIAVMDSDDISLPDRFDYQLTYLVFNPHIFLVGSSAIFIDDKGNEIKRFRKYNNYKILGWRLQKSCGIVHSSVMFKNMGERYNEGFYSAHDYDFYLRMLSKGKYLTNLPAFLIKHRVHKESAHSNSSNQRMFKNLTQLIHSDLKKPPIYKKIFYSFKLLIHYLKTYKEKRK